MPWYDDYYQGSSDYPHGHASLDDAWSQDGTIDGHTWIADGILGGFDRAQWAVINEEELILAYQLHERPDAECGYCGVKCPRTRDVHKAIHWFHAHDCATLELAEAAGLVLDIQPFAEAA